MEGANAGAAGGPATFAGATTKSGGTRNAVKFVSLFLFFFAQLYIIFLTAFFSDFPFFHKTNRQFSPRPAS